MSAAYKRVGGCVAVGRRRQEVGYTYLLDTIGVQEKWPHDL